MLWSVAQAAHQLQISDRQLRRAIQENLLIAEPVGSSHVIHARQLEAFSRINHRGRHWTVVTQNAALSLLSHQPVEDLDSTEKSRLKHRIQHMDVHSLVGQMMRGRYSLRRAAATSTRDELDVSILTELGLTRMGGNTVLVAEDASIRARELLLAKDSTGDIVLIEGDHKHRKVLEASGLYIYGDSREHAAARNWLEERRSEI